MNPRLSLPAALALTWVPVAHAIDIVDSGASGAQVNLSGTYTQNFDSLASSPQPGGYAWDNNVTLPGWYSTQSLYDANRTNGGLASFGSDSDRALGSIATNWSLRFVNSSSQTISGFSVSFDVEQWFRASNSPQVSNSLHLYYRVYSASISEAVEAGNILSGGWTHIPSATFTSPNASLTSAAFLDGNLLENQGHVSVTISGITLAPGEKLWLQWITGDEPGNDHAFATDNVQVSFLTGAIPEPSSAALLFGLAAFAFARLRRKARRNPSLGAAPVFSRSAGIT